MITGIIIPLSAFAWMYFEGRDKRKTALEIARHLDDSNKIEELLAIFEERKKEPLDYRRS